jgi:hypothetical protein
VPKTIVSDRDVKFVSYFWKTLWAKLGTKLLFSTTCHPQTDGQTEVVNRTLSMLLRTMVKKNLKDWKECLPHVEFAYNRAVHSTTNLCPFKIVYGFKPIAPIDLLPLPLQERINMEASKRAAYIKKIHEKTKEAIELKVVRKAASMNKHRKKVLFEPGDLVWIHLCKEHFLEQRKSKLMPRGDGPFHILAKINDNAYKIDLPPSYGVSNMLNVADLLLVKSEDTLESRTTPFQGEEDDTTTPLSNILQTPNQATSTQVQPTSSPTQVFDGPITRSRAKKLQQEVHALLYKFQLNTNENFMLPKSCMLILLRFTKEEGQNTSRANQKEELCPSQSSATEPSRRNSHIF